jgi:hypothetical protein
MILGDISYSNRNRALRTYSSSCSLRCCESPHCQPSPGISSTEMNSRTRSNAFPRHIQCLVAVPQLKTMWRVHSSFKAPGELAEVICIAAQLFLLPHPVSFPFQDWFQECSLPSQSLLPRPRGITRYYTAEMHTILFQQTRALWAYIHTGVPG